MKQFLLTFTAVLIGGFLALLGYDHFIVKPREAATRAEAAAEADVQKQTPRPDVDLSRSRDEAKKVAAELEASVQRSVENARNTIEAQASEMGRRELIVDAVRRATMFRVGLTEYYQTNGRWPRDAEEAGLPPSEDFRGGAVRSIEVGQRGVVEVAFDNTFAAGSRVMLRPLVKPSGMIEWECDIVGDPLLKRALPRCKSL